MSHSNLRNFFHMQASSILFARYEQLSTISLDNLIMGNNVSEGGYGPDFASRFHEMRLTSNLTSDGFIVEDHLSGRNLPIVQLDILDSFGQPITAGIPDSGRYVDSMRLLITI